MHIDGYSFSAMSHSRHRSREITARTFRDCHASTSICHARRMTRRTVVSIVNDMLLHLVRCCNEVL